MSDTEEDFQPKIRPQSTFARLFSEQLDGLFMINNRLEKLNLTVLEKKQSVSLQSKELSELEARLRQTEKLLEEKTKRLSLQFCPNSGASSSSQSPDRARPPIPNYEQDPTVSETQTPERAPPPPPGGAVVPPSRLPPPPPGKDKLKMERSNSSLAESYKARPPPPVPADR
ncbi:hypothetical protein RUND412_009590 [Rhizina undulata]